MANSLTVSNIWHEVVQLLTQHLEHTYRLLTFHLSCCPLMFVVHSWGSVDFVRYIQFFSGARYLNLNLVATENCCMHVCYCIIMFSKILESKRTMCASCLQIIPRFFSNGFQTRMCVLEFFNPFFAQTITMYIPQSNNPGWFIIIIL